MDEIPRTARQKHGHRNRAGCNNGFPVMDGWRHAPLPTKAYSMLVPTFEIHFFLWILEEKHPFFN